MVVRSKDWTSSVSACAHSHAQWQAIAKVLRLSVGLEVPDLIDVSVDLALGLLRSGALVGDHVHLDRVCSAAVMDLRRQCRHIRELEVGA